MEDGHVLARPTWAENVAAQDMHDEQRHHCCRKFTLTVYDIADILLSLSFLIGSILFYPCFHTYEVVNSFQVAAWLFIVGSALMLMLMSRDLQIIVSALRQLDSMVQSARRRSTIVQLLDHSTVGTWEIMNFVLYVNSGILFVVGSAFFLPTLYAKNANLGCTLFIIGCLCQLIAALWDTARVLTQEGKKTMKDIWILFLPPAIGLLLFLIGCLFFYPRYQNDTFDAIYATTYFVVGSVSFLISSSMKVVVLSGTFEAQQESTPEDREQTLLLRRRTIIN